MKTKLFARQATALAAALTTNTSVRTLKLRYNEIRDEGASALVLTSPLDLLIRNSIIAAVFIGFLSSFDPVSGFAACSYPVLD